MHILNVYKDQTILEFKRGYASEKLHGTSSHLTWKDRKLTFFSGGASYASFCALFDADTLSKVFEDQFGDDTATLYGEAYGGKEQGMSKTYGDKLKFCAFALEVNNRFLDMKDAEVFAIKAGQDFVPYEEIELTPENLDAMRDKPSEQAVKNGMGNSTDRFGFCPPIREGVVVVPLHEFKDKWGNRVVAKHKRIEFQERQNQPSVIDADKQKVLDDANAVAEEWVNAVRLEHVLDRLGNPKELSMTGKVINAMIEDVMREAKGEIADTKEIRKAVGAKAGNMFKKLVMKV